MKKFILPIVFGLVFTSCSRDEDATTANNTSTSNQTPILPTSVTWSDNNGDSGNATFTYDGDKIKEIVYGGGKTSFIYTGDLITSMITNEGKDTNTYTYNTDGTLKSAEIVYAGENSTGNTYTTTTTRNYTYNSNGEITINESVVTNNPYAGNHTKTYTAILTGGNLYRIVEQHSSNSTTNGSVEITNTTTYQYDTLNNPFKNIKGLAALALELHDDEFLSTFTNNITHKEKVSTSKYTPVGGSETKFNTTTTNTIKYEYNTSGYPTKIVDAETSSSNSTPYIQTTTYTYNK